MDDVIAYLSRLTGEQVSVDHTLRLRSVHRAAFVSWARKQNLPIRLDVMSSGAPCTVRSILGGGEDAPAKAPIEAQLAPPLQVTQDSRSIPFTGIGIDIEDVDNLPQSDDYREHPFFQDHFSDTEIAYCIQQADARASFCGIWAAKEAILKSGLIPSSSRKLNQFQVSRDEVGRPVFSGCHLSISHTSKTAVAVCVSTAATRPMQPPLNVPEPAIQSVASPTPRDHKKWPWSRRRQ